MKRISALLLFWFFIEAIPLYAQASRLHFEHLTIEDGLSQNSIFALLQDKYGLLWIGTEVGLNIYDGYRIRTFTRDADDMSSLSDNTVTVLWESPEGDVWIGTDSGLNRFHRSSETFERIHDQEQGFYATIAIKSLLGDRNGYLWIGTSGHGLFRYDPRSKGIDRHYIHVPGDPSTLAQNDIQCMFMDLDGVFWIGTAGSGINRFDPHSGMFQQLEVAVPHQFDLSGVNARALVRSRQRSNELWIGTWDRGLILYDLIQRSAKLYQPSTIPGSLSHHEIRTILEDSEGTIWVGTSAGGVNRFDRQQQTFTHYTHSAHILDSISQDDISVIYEDRCRIVWIGTISAGLNKYVRHHNLFNRYRHDPFSPGSLPDSSVRSLLIDRQQQLWIGTYRGLIQYDASRDSFVPAQKGETEQAGGRKLIECLAEDAESGIWLASFAGIARYDQQTKTFTWYEHRKEDLGSLSHQIVYAILADSKGRIWAGTYRGLNRLDPGARYFVHYLHDANDPKTIPHNMVITLYEDGDGSIWVGTAGGGLAHLDSDSQRFSTFAYKQGDRNSLSHNSVSAICRDNRGRFWVGTADGLNLMDEARGIFTRFGRKNGLPSSSVAAIIPDDTGKLWISHTAGLSWFNPESGSVRNFTSKDGLQGTEFNRGAAIKAINGELFFGGINGFNRFFPSDLLTIHHLAPIHITELTIMGQAWTGPHPLYDTSKIRLKASQDQMSISFASENYSSPELTYYQYILEGIDKGWTYSGHQRTAHYSQLPPGHFVFKVRASLDGSNWGGEALKLYVEKIPHFWMTWWFRSLFLIFLAAAVYAFTLFRVRALRHRLSEETRIRKVLEESQQELHRAHQVAALRLAQLRELMSSLTSVLIAVDRNRTISECNVKAAEFFRTERESMLDKPIDQFLTGAFSSLNQVLEWAFDVPVMVKEKQFVLDQDREHRLYHLWVYPIMTEESQFQGLLLLLDDITEQTNMETQQYLWEKLKTIGQLQAEITHEIGTPIQEAKFQAYLLEKSLESGQVEKKMDRERAEEIREGIAIIQNNIDHVFAIIKSAKELFYPGRNQKETVNTNKLIETTLMVTKNSLQKKARIRVELGEDIPPIIAYPAELSQVFLNLLGNAADAVGHLAGKGEITIRTRHSAGNVIIEVSDNGTGIDPVVGTQIFAPFFTTKKAGKGTGQGPTLSRAIVENRHGGKIFWQNRAEGGVVFTVQLPLVTEE